MVGNGFERQAAEENCCRSRFENMRCPSGSVLVGARWADCSIGPARGPCSGRARHCPDRRPAAPVPPSPADRGIRPSGCDCLGGRPEAGKVAPDGSSPSWSRRLSYSRRLRFASLSFAAPPVLSMWCISLHAHLTRGDAQADSGVEKAALHRAEIADRLRLARLLELEIGLAVEGRSGGLRLRHPIVEALLGRGFGSRSSCGRSPIRCKSPIGR